MDESIKNYLANELHKEEHQFDVAMEKLLRHEDLLNEFKKWIETKDFNAIENPIRVENYSAADIAKRAPFMTGLGVYNFLVSLREEPEQAKEYINKGFPRK